ncbi:MAG: acetyl-CoA carboxylase biotin carboxylase subunit [Bacteroidota bacterium]|nr:acetyl-CoA carboxylase biotin carboxylase subunit [Bacteroidota bacterium]
MKKLLIANRGEIARRIIRTAKKMGINTVAVFSEADRSSLFVQEADEAICIGPASSSESYLNIKKIVQAAKLTNANAIHPGYGFLSERAAFSKAVTEAGFIFIGPSHKSIEMMGDKLEAKKCANEMKVPILSGSGDAMSDIPSCKAFATKIGYPVLIKATAGGGGKGMRVVHEESNLVEQLELASSEAMSSFGNGSVFIEKYLIAPKHIEVQIIADQLGNCCYLFERECSIQRRHQKIIEEAPSPSISEEVRKEMGEAAVRMAKSCNYSNAGTVEFLFEDGKFYFMEMNTRLQVEHPVTEGITGLDLVELQIEIARGHMLPFQQSELKIAGHSIEVRINAEDPYVDFTPSTGYLNTYRIPKGDGIRVDDAYAEKQEIPIHYDSMIAKLIVHASTRELAIQKMKQALSEYVIEGIQTIIPYATFILNHKKFQDATMDTTFVRTTFDEFLQTGEDNPDLKAAAMIAIHAYLEKFNKVRVPDNSNVSWLHLRNEKR